jgi:hypothetical protein
MIIFVHSYILYMVKYLNINAYKNNNERQN